MTIKAYKRFKKSYKSLPENIQTKADRQLDTLETNFRHPFGSFFPAIDTSIINTYTTRI